MEKVQIQISQVFPGIPGKLWEFPGNFPIPGKLKKTGNITSLLMGNKQNKGVKFQNV